MKYRLFKMTAVLSIMVACVCLFIGCPTGASSPALAIFHTDTLKLSYYITGTTAITSTKSFSAAAVRNAGNSGMDSTLVIYDLSIKLDPSDSQTRAIVRADSSIPINLQASFWTTGSPETFLSTASGGIAIGHLLGLMGLNNGLYVATPGFNDLPAAIVNPLVDSIHVSMQVNLQQAPSATGLAHFNVIIQEAAKLGT